MARFGWSAEELCQSAHGGVRIVKYTPWEKEPNKRLHDLGLIELAPWKGEVVSGAVTLFGIVIECENAMVIAGSNGETFTLPEEPVNWRTFPRSKHYENHMHLMRPHRAEILSFNHDYFVEQKEKRAGAIHFDRSDA